MFFESNRYEIEFQKGDDMAKLAVIGSGVVGQATGKGFIAKGHDVVFCDINPEVLAKLKLKGYVTYLPDLLEHETGVEVFFLAISTPTVDGKIHLGFLEAAVANLGSVFKKHDGYCIVVVRSTVPPGTTRGLLIPLLEKYSGKKVGVHFGACVNPEYLRGNSNEEDFKDPWLITIGELDNKSGEILERIYGPSNCPIAHLSLEEAEVQKYIHNLWNACKISFFNEQREICQQIKVNVDQVFRLVMMSAEASWNSNYGIRDLGPFNGTCLPKDTVAFLTWAKDKLGKNLPLLRAVIKVNEIVKERYNGLR